MDLNTIADLARRHQATLTLRADADDVIVDFTGPGICECAARPNARAALRVLGQRLSAAGLKVDDPRLTLARRLGEDQRGQISAVLRLLRDLRTEMMDALERQCIAEAEPVLQSPRSSLNPAHLQGER